MLIRVLRVLLPILILVVGVGSFKIIMSKKKQPDKKPAKFSGVLVETEVVSLTSKKAVINRNGSIEPAQEVKIVARSSGNILWVNPKLVEGETVKKGDVLIRIEKSDYEIAVQQAKASFEQAKYNLVKVQSEAEVAKDQWEKWKKMKKELVGDDQVKPHPLALYEPQINNAEAAMLSAKAALEKAELELKRTVVRAPFDSVINSESVEVGQYIRTGEQIAELYGLGAVEVIVPVSLKELSLIDEGSKDQPNAVVTLSSDGTDYKWKGYYARNLATVDSAGKMMRIVVSVPEPLKSDVGFYPAKDMFANVDVIGKTIDNIVVIPRKGFREGGKVWVFDQGKLRIVNVKTIWETRENVWVIDGLNGGEDVIMSPISAPVDGMTVKKKDFMQKKGN